MIKIAIEYDDDEDAEFAERLVELIPYESYAASGTDIVIRKVEKNECTQG